LIDIYKCALKSGGVSVQRQVDPAVQSLAGDRFDAKQ